jgi:MutS domain V
MAGLVVSTSDAERRPAPHPARTEPRTVRRTEPALPRFRRVSYLAAQFLDWLSPRRRTLREPRSRWGKPGANDGWLASRYFELTRVSGGDRQIDDRTWSDLEFPRIFAKLDSALTRLGSQSLYRRLRTYQDDDAAAREEYAAWQTLRSDRNLRESIQLILAGLQADSAAYLCDHVFGEPLRSLKHPVWIALWGLLCLAVLASVLASAVSPLALIAVLAVNAAIIFGLSPRANGLVEDLRGACDFVAVAGRLARLRSPERIPQLDALRAASDVLRDARRAFRGFKFFQRAEFGIGIWLNLLCFAEWVAYTHTVGRFNALRERLRHVYELVGSLDAAIAVASFLEHTDAHCVPRFGKDGSLEIEAGCHPLLSAPVCNSIALRERSALVSGSNMAGKTTFVKMVAINVVLGRTLGICLAARALLPRASVLASIRAEHSTESGKSRYFAEMEALLSFLGIAADGHQPIIVIDEPFSGTNTAERIAAAKAVLAALAERAIVLATTHDVELQGLLGDRFEAYHFREDPDVDGFFDYRLRSGPCTEGNALRLLAKIGFPPEVVADAVSVVRSSQPREPLKTR